MSCGIFTSNWYMNLFIFYLVSLEENEILSLLSYLSSRVGDFNTRFSATAMCLSVISFYPQLTHARAVINLKARIREIIRQRRRRRGNKNMKIKNSKRHQFNLKSHGNYAGLNEKRNEKKKKEIFIFHILKTKYRKILV